MSTEDSLHLKSLRDIAVSGQAEQFLTSQKRYCLGGRECNVPLNTQFHSPLHVACAKGWVDVVSYLLENRQCSVHGHPACMSSPLHVCVETTHIPLVALLLRYGARTEGYYGRHRRTVLGTACFQGASAYQVNLQLDKGASLIEPADRDGNSLHSMLCVPHRYALPRVLTMAAEALLDRGYDNRNFLPDAILHDKPDIACLLLRKGNVVTDPALQTAACQHGNQEQVQTLLAKGLPVRNGENVHAISIAALHGHYAVLRYIFGYVGISGISFHEVLLQACSGGNRFCVEYVLDMYRTVDLD